MGMEKDRIFATVKRNLLVVMPDLEPESILIDQTLADLGCNSIDRMDVVTMTMEELEVTVPIFEFGNVRNIRTLVEVLQKYL
jgi:polyketide biosynthesis acyl carrier protein